MQQARPYSSLIDKLRHAGLRPTRQRLALAKLLFSSECSEKRHVTAEQLRKEAVREGIQVSLATIYNTLHQFTDAGLLREVVVERERSYFDTNTTDHHHLFVEETGELIDLPQKAVALSRLPVLPAGLELTQVDLTLRVKRT